MKVRSLVVLTCIVILGMASIAMARPTVVVPKIDTPPTIDGKLDDKAWLDASLFGSKVVVDLWYANTRIVGQKSMAYLAYDDKNLYVAIVNYVEDASKLDVNNNSWGSADGAEVCFAPPTSSSNAGAVFAIWSFPSGIYKITVPIGSGTVKGDESAAVKTAASIGPNYWAVEYAISLEAFDIKVEEGKGIDFNIGALDAANRDWKAWKSTGGSNFNVANAGTLIWGGVATE